MSVRSIAVAAAVLLGSLALLGCGISPQARFSRTDTLLKTHIPAAPIHARVSNGSIEVRAGDADEVQISAEIKALTQERLDQTMLVVSRNADQTLDVSVHWPDGKRRNNEGCTLTITLPDAGTIALKTSNGRLTVTGVGTDLDLRTSNGRIVASQIPGSVYGRTSNGRVILNEIGGEIDVDTSNGRLILTEITGPIRAETSNGSVQVELTDAATGPIDVTTSNGSATVAVGSDFNGQLRLNTSNGRVKIEDQVKANTVSLTKSNGTIDFGGSGSSRVRTSNGSVTITAVEE